MSRMDENNFFEADEPIEDVRAAFHSGNRGRTRKPFVLPRQSGARSFAAAKTYSPAVADALSNPGRSVGGSVVLSHR